MPKGTVAPKNKFLKQFNLVARFNWFGDTLRMRSAGNTPWFSFEFEVNKSEQQGKRSVRVEAFEAVGKFTTFTHFLKNISCV